MTRGLLRTLVAVAVGAVAWSAWYLASTTGRDVFPTEFHVEPGSTLKQTALQLEAAGIIDHAYAFILLGRLTGKSGGIKAGSYLFSAPMTPMALLRKLTEGETLLGKITFIEGWTFRQMRAALDGHPRLRHETAGMSDAELMAALGLGDLHPEGQFFPDTYYFDSGSRDLELLQWAHRHLRRTLETAWSARVPGLPYATPYEALIMASIVEKETGAPEERALIAAVFVNRLKLGMRLQTDPTVIYGLGDRFDGNLRKEHLLMDTPYNTYLRAGLPPTPIAMPGEASLRAALNPEESRVLYFVAKGDGRHQFSTTLEEHNRAVNRYQRGRR